MSQVVYLNGAFVPYEQALVPVEDRGFVFADGVYEVIRCYRGRPFRLEDHLQRLERSAAAIRLPLPMDRAALAAACVETVARNGLADADAAIYLQVTRGPAPRTHAFPAQPRQTTLIIARAEKGPDPALRAAGVRAITVPDIRWQMCHVKSVGLLANVLAKQQALEAGCYEGIFVRDGIVTEGTASNLFMVFDGRLVTHPEGPHILSGVTRQAVLELAEQAGIPAELARVPVARLFEADEVFVTGTITEIMPIVAVDGRTIGTGSPGPVTRRLIGEFAALTGAAVRV